MGCCFDVAASRNEPGAKLSGIQEWHPAALGAGSAACALASWQFGHLSGNQTAKWKIITLFTSECTADMRFFNNKPTFSSLVVPTDWGDVGPQRRQKPSSAVPGPTAWGRAPQCCWAGAKCSPAAPSTPIQKSSPPFSSERS